MILYHGLTLSLLVLFVYVQSPYQSRYQVISDETVNTQFPDVSQERRLNLAFNLSEFVNRINLSFILDSEMVFNYVFKSRPIQR